MENYTLLYVDDEAENLTSFKYLFKKKFKVILANSAQEGLEILKEENVQIVISDQKMPGMTGIEFLERVFIEHPETIRILLTGYIETLVSASNLKNGVIYKCMSKPFEVDEMTLALTEALEFYKSQNKGN